MKAASRLVSSLCRISLAIALAFALGAGVFSPVARVHAETRSGHQFTYYNNAQHQTVVGVWVWCNDGQNYHWGTVTPYDTITASGC
jgi:hypothetical protein